MFFKALHFSPDTGILQQTLAANRGTVKLDKEDFLSSEGGQITRTMLVVSSAPFLFSLLSGWSEQRSVVPDAIFSDGGTLN